MVRTLSGFAKRRPTLGDAQAPPGSWPSLVVIDGPAGCGKSTVARALAAALGGVAFGTGLLYRAVTWLGLSEGVPLKDPARVAELLAAGRIRLVERVGEVRCLVDGTDPGSALHTPEVTREIHWVADAPQVRAALLPVQRCVSRDRVMVAEGRDLGTEVFPGASLKVFLTASLEERARRRLRDWRGDEEAEVQRVRDEIATRDARDSSRTVAPLRPAAEALVIDSTSLGVEEVVEQILVALPPGWPGGGATTRRGTGA